MKVDEEEIGSQGSRISGKNGEPDGDDGLQMMLDYVKECPAIFQSQQMGDPELTKADKSRIAEEILLNKPVNFLIKFGKFLTEDHLNYFLKKYESSYEINFYVTNLKSSLGDQRKNLIKRNRRYEAMKRMETEGSYFCEAEMEKREPLLYYQMVGQYLSKKEKVRKHWEANKNVIPTFSNYLIDKLEKEEVNKLMALQQDEEDRYLLNENSCGQNNSSLEVEEEDEEETCLKMKWGTDWEDEEEYIRVRSNKVKKQKRVGKSNSQEKALLFDEFKSIMQNKFLNGQEVDFNYSDIDSNSDYDCLDIRAQDEEERYFDNESCDSNYVCTDTGVQDY